MAFSARSWPPSAVALLAAGVTLIAAGLYFVFLRPPLLPEDVRYLGLPQTQLVAVRPGLEAWLTHVFRVMGGYVLATGVLAATLAATSYRNMSGEQGSACSSAGPPRSAGWLSSTS